MSTTEAAHASPDRHRVAEADWTAIAAEIGELGCATTPQLLNDADAAELIRLYDRDVWRRFPKRLANPWKIRAGSRSGRSLRNSSSGSPPRRMTCIEPARNWKASLIPRATS